MATNYAFNANTCPAIIAENASFRRGSLVALSGNPSALYPMKGDGYVARAILQGLHIVDDGGLTIHLAPGKGIGNKVHEIHNPSEKVTLLDDKTRIFVWATKTGAIRTALTNAIPTDGYYFCGSVVTAGGDITSIDESGVLRMNGGVLYRRTAGAGVPNDTPPSNTHLLHQTVGGVYLWNGAAYVLLGDGGTVNAEQAAEADLGATTNLDAVPADFADLAAVRTYLAGANVMPMIETRLDNLEAKVDAVLVKLRLADIIADA